MGSYPHLHPQQGAEDSQRPPMHMQIKCMATPPQLRCMQLTCATDAPPIKCSGSGASDTVASQPSHCKARLNKEVCIRHFTENQIRRTAEAYDEKGKRLVVHLKRFYLRVGAIPCVFKDDMGQSKHSAPLNNYLNRKKKLQVNETIEKCNKDLTIDNVGSSNSGVASLRSKEESSVLRTFRDFTECLVSHKFGDWHSIEKDNIVLFAMISLSKVPTISVSAVVNTNLEVRIFKGKSEMKSLNGKEFPLKISNMNEFEIILNDLSSESSVCLEKVINNNVRTSIALLKEVIQHDNSLRTQVSFLCEQMNQILDKKYHKYSMEYIIFSCILWLISPYAYQYLIKAQLFALPQIHTLCKLCPKYDPVSNSENLNIGDLIYIRQRARNLQPKDLVVSLAIDEIRLKPYFSKTDSDVLQKALNITSRAKVAQVYTVKSLNSSFKEVVHILPVQEMDSDTLFLIIKKMITTLHEIGFNVVCVVSNNSPISKGAMSNFVSPPATQIVYKHPVDRNKPLFYVFDSTHILQNIRNDWVNQSDELLIFPEFDITCDRISVADFSELQKLCEVEISRCKRKLTSLSPIVLKQHNIRSVLNIFNKSVIEALKQNGEKCEFPYFKTTTGFMEIIEKWWSVMNTTVFSENISESYKFLEDCLVWLDHWASFELVENRFSDETHEAFTHTIYSFLQLAEYCRSELNLEYILPSKIQTDILEARYGRYKTVPIYEYRCKVAASTFSFHLVSESSGGPLLISPFISLTSSITYPILSQEAGNTLVIFLRFAYATSPKTKSDATAEAIDEKGNKLIVSLQKPRLKFGVIPCVFENNVGVSSRKHGPERKKKLKYRADAETENNELKADNIELSTIDVVLPDFNEKSNVLKTFHNFKERLVSAVVNTDLKVRIFKGKSEMKSLNDKEFPFKISNIDEFAIILNDLSTSSVSSEKIINDNVHASIALLKEVIQHDNSLHTRVSFVCEQMNQILDKRQRARNLQPKDLIVSLVIDEIRLRPYFSKTDSDVLQKALNITSRAKVAQVYTVKSLNSSFKEVVHVLPVQEMDSDTLFLIIKNDYNLARNRFQRGLRREQQQPHQ
ncbi:Transposable element P transposase [Eumeta japonica]|uniref:Transposable element P transposase n=1 Tax=Eumeta variegata TaxID=151549 RepID=A0A4C1WGF8_EUMVA|nr:Transposable element P transposase [Eumeta japonica]